MSFDTLLLSRIHFTKLSSKMISLIFVKITLIFVIFLNLKNHLKIIITSRIIIYHNIIVKSIE